MVHAGANIEAFLKLDASGFKSGIGTATSALNQFKESAEKISGNVSKSTNAITKFINALMEIGESSSVISTGINNINKALDALLPKLSQFTNLTAESKNFKTFASGLMNIAEAAQRLGVDIERGSVGMTALSEVMKIWETGVASAEATFNLSANAVRNLVNSINQSNGELNTNSNEVRNLRNSYGESLNVLRQFHTALNSENQALLMVTNVMKQYELGQTNVARGNTTLTTSFNNMRNSVTTFGQTLNNTSKDFVTKFTQVEPIINNVSGEFARLKAEIGQVSESYRVLKINQEGENVTLERSAVALEKNSQEMLKNAEAKLRAMGYTGELTGLEQRLGNAETETTTKTNQATSSIQRQSSAMTQASGSANRMTSATNGLSKALQSLKMVGTLVASMMVWNFASSLINATRETVNAKSEMEGYFKMLNFSQKDINQFNSALDRTVQQFQRVNKYSMGETISSIGVEFDLTTKEMEKAMKVTAMVTSEYLRAGRNANEASLAVKDVLQGQFQRLSRETGVKGEQLKEAGWSGDNTDVLSLMEALEKVGESRNWDVFASKANSLNDMVLILQNRFGEWSADMVYTVQPAIVGAFNMIMSTAEKFGSIMSGIWEWINSDGLAQSIIQWTGLATAIGGVVTAIISYRTGASLLQIAQMGLRNSIVATIFGLDAETVSTYGSLTAIKSKILGVEAEKVSTLKVRDAILSKVLGLDAEIVAEQGVKAGLIENTIARETQILTLKKATAEEIANTTATLENGLAQRSSIGILSARVLGLNMSTYATHGFTVALLEMTTQMKASELASMGLGKKLLLLGASVGVPMAIVGAFAVTLGVLAWRMHESAEAMKEFNNMVQNGDDIIKEAKDTVQYYTDKQEALKKKLSETTKYTEEYRNVQDQLRATNQDLITSNENLENTYKAIQVARSSQKHFEETRTEQAIELQGKLAEAYREAGYSSVEASEMANDSLLEANEGAKQLYETLQKIAQIDYKSLQTAVDLGDTLKDVDKDTAKQYLEGAERYHAMMDKGLEKAMTDESFMGRLDGWFTYYEGQILNWFNNLSANLEAGDIYGAIQGAFWGIVHGLAKLPIIKDFWNYVFEESGITKYKGQGFSGLANIFKESFLAILDMGGLGNLYHIVYDIISSNLAPTIGWLAELYNDPLSAMGLDWLKDFNLIDAILNAIFGETVSASDGSSDHPEVAEEMNQVIVQPIANFLNGFMSDPISYIGAFVEMLPISQLLLNLFPVDDGSFILTWVQNNIGLPLGTAFYNTIMSIPLVSDILQLFGLVTGENSGASQKGTDIGTAFKTGVENIIRNIPILGWIAEKLGLIPQQNPNANQKGHGIGSNINQGTMSGMDNLGSKILQEFNDALSGIGKLGQQAYDTAKGWAEQLWNGVNSILQRKSPGFFHDQFKAEFGTDIPNAITESSSTAYTVAQTYAQNIQDGIASAQGSTIGLDGMVSEYQTDAQTVSMYSQMMGTETTTAFNDMNLAVNSTTSSMSANVTSSYSTMQQKQSSLLQNMKNSNTTAYNEMYQKSNQSLLQMRDSTSNITTQMIGAWDHMKVQLVATANALRSESTNHFNQLSNTIGAFYRKIQNPSNWGSAGSSSLKQGTPNRRVGRRVASTLKPNGYSGGGSRWTGKNTMSIGALKSKICPNGQCGDLFDGYNPSDIVDVNTFLSMVSGEHGFGWGNWKGTHYNYIKNKSDAWDMKSPVINLVGGIPTNSNFKVGDFNNGQPKISFSSFQGMAESIFSAIPYRFYYDSSWKGSWLGALQSGACNCYDGASALIAFANACGFGGYMAHGTWTDADGSSYGHVWAVIDGKKMDTTGWQQRGTWTPSASAGSPNRSSSSTNNEVHIHIDMSNSVNYGTDDIEDRIEEGVKRGLREQFSNPVTVRI